MQRAGAGVTRSCPLWPMQPSGGGPRGLPPASLLPPDPRRPSAIPAADSQPLRPCAQPVAGLCLPDFAVNHLELGFRNRDSVGMLASSVYSGWSGFGYKRQLRTRWGRKSHKPVVSVAESQKSLEERRQSLGPGGSWEEEGTWAGGQGAVLWVAEWGKGGGGGRGRRVAVGGQVGTGTRRKALWAGPLASPALTGWVRVPPALTDVTGNSVWVGT